MIEIDHVLIAVTDLATAAREMEGLAALANVPETQRPDRMRLDQATLMGLAGYSSGVFMQVRSPGEESPTESSIQRPSHLAIGVAIVKGPSPLAQTNQRRAAAKMSSHPRGQGGTPGPKPLGGLSVELVPREFVHNDAAARTQ